MGNKSVEFANGSGHTSERVTKTQAGSGAIPIEHNKKKIKGPDWGLLHRAVERILRRSHTHLETRKPPFPHGR
jgi:hypothetical protein